MTLIGSLTANTLPSAVTAAGTVGFVLYSSGGSLTVPTDATLFPGTLTERVDLVPGEIYPSEMEFSFVEDYTTYTGGFWWLALVL